MKTFRDFAVMALLLSLTIALAGPGGCVEEFKYFMLDRDKDGVPNLEDNCPDFPNPDQTDTNGDGVGDVCGPAPEDFIIEGEAIEIVETEELMDDDPDQRHFSSNVTIVGPDGEPAPGKYHITGNIVRAGFEYDPSTDTYTPIGDYDYYVFQSGEKAWIRAELTWDPDFIETDYDIYLYGLWEDGSIHDTRDLFNECGTSPNDTEETYGRELAYTPHVSCTISYPWGDEENVPYQADPNTILVLLVVGYDGATLDYEIALDVQ
ncbi:MAG: hypothetical protein D6812_16480 [Deltaproteobacteria bacterium]|nr:MAG: hypothetical protein D6812_16480 [Deltaproteobacteria bacterium]